MPLAYFDLDRRRRAWDARYLDADCADSERRLLRPRPGAHSHHVALGGLTDNDGGHLALGAEWRERHAQLGAARSWPHGSKYPVAGASRDRLSDANSDWRSGLDSVHGNDLPWRPFFGAGRSL